MPSDGGEREFGGEGGIRTHGGLAPTTVFETAPFDRSGTSPHPVPTGSKAGQAGAGPYPMPVFAASNAAPREGAIGGGDLRAGWRRHIVLYLDCLPTRK